MPPLPSGTSLADQPLRSGERVAVVGRTGSGRSELLAGIAGARWLGFSSKDGRRSLQEFAPKGLGGASRLTEVVSAAGLWERRAEPLESLSSGERAAAAIAVGLLDQEGILAIDGHFDALDPWRRAALFEVAGEATLVIATHDLELAARCDRVAVLKRGSVVAFAPPEELAALQGGTRFEVETGMPGATRELIAPLAVDVEETADGLGFRAREGQEMAARLLLAGYGSVRSFVVRTPTLADAVAALV